MKLRVFFLTVCSLLFSTYVYAASVLKTGSLDLTQSNQTVSAESFVDIASIGLSVDGTWTGTLTFQATVDGTNWYTINTINGTTSTTANGIFQFAVAGLKNIRVINLTTGTGTATVTLNTSLGALGSFTGNAGTPSQVTVSVTASSTAILAAGAATNFVKVCVAATQANGIWVMWNGTTATAAPPSEYIAPGQCDLWLKSSGFQLQSAINGIASATVPITVIYN